MKVCITAWGTSLDGPAPYAVFVDEETGAVSALENGYAGAAAASDALDQCRQKKLERAA